MRVYSHGCKQGCFQPPPVARRFHGADSPIWRFCPGFGQIGGKRLHCKPILGTWLSRLFRRGGAEVDKPLVRYRLSRSPKNDITWPRLYVLYKTFYR